MKKYELTNEYITVDGKKAIQDPEQIPELQERDLAKRPDLEGDGYFDGELIYDTWICPNCGKRYEVYYDDYKFCPNCGQRLKMEG